MKPADLEKLQQQQENLAKLMIDSEQRIEHAVNSLPIQQLDASIKNAQRAIIETTRHYEETLHKKLVKSIMQKFGFAIIEALLVAFFVSMYLTGELPWESRTRALQERDIGQSIIKTWPNLNEKQKQHIEEKLNLRSMKPAG